MHEFDSSSLSFASPKDRSEEGRILGLDIGDKRIGMAVSDPMGITAQGLPTLVRNGAKQAVRDLMGIIMKYDIKKIVYGIPKNMDGSLGPQAGKTEEFIRKLKSRTDCPFIPCDERLTSMHAHKALMEAGMSRKKRSANVDRVSAVLILQNYLDLLNRTGGIR
ncbi:Holliday junction resolvase RuvX [bacterium]|nr:Holliday junction resolvase RuvX [bacterium]